MNFSDGFLVGREAQLADWRFRREQREFKALVNRLRVARWTAANLERKRAAQRAYASRPEVAARYAAAAKQRRAVRAEETT